MRLPQPYPIQQYSTLTRYSSSTPSSLLNCIHSSPFSEYSSTVGPTISTPGNAEMPTSLRYSVRFPSLFLPRCARHFLDANLNLSIRFGFGPASAHNPFAILRRSLHPHHLASYSRRT